MNELQRQTYLSALGVDTYMPRFQLSFAPVAHACEAQSLRFDTPSLAAEMATEPVVISQVVVTSSSVGTSPVGSLVGNIFDFPKISKPSAQPITAADILSQLDNKPQIIEPFSLSIWRPLEDVMIVDSRNTKLALPTELLLQNMLRACFHAQITKLQDEVLRWPAIENSFAKRSVTDARIELQTWLSVQHEIRPFRFLLLMGKNAATYLLPENKDYQECIFEPVQLADSVVKALILPSLNELLQKPATKKSLYSALRIYLTASL